MENNPNSLWAFAHNCARHDDSFVFVKRVASVVRMDMREALQTVRKVSDTATMTFARNGMYLEADRDDGLAGIRTRVRTRDVKDGLYRILPAGRFSTVRAMQAMKGMRNHLVDIAVGKDSLGFMFDRKTLRVEYAEAGGRTAPRGTALFSADARGLLKAINNVCAGMGGTTREVFFYPDGGRFLLTDGDGRSYTAMVGWRGGKRPFGLPVAAARRVLNAAGSSRLRAAGIGGMLAISWPDTESYVRTVHAPKRPRLFMPSRYDRENRSSGVGLDGGAWSNIFGPAARRCRKINAVIDLDGLHCGFFSADGTYMSRIDMPHDAFEWYAGDVEKIGFRVDPKGTMRLLERIGNGYFVDVTFDSSGAVVESAGHYYRLPWTATGPAYPPCEPRFKPDAASQMHDPRHALAALNHFRQVRGTDGFGGMPVSVEIGDGEITLRDPDTGAAARMYADCHGRAAGTFPAGLLHEAFSAVTGESTMEIMCNAATRIRWDASFYMFAGSYTSMRTMRGLPSSPTAVAYIAADGRSMGAES